MNKNEYGNKIRVDADEDISLNTNTLVLTSPQPVVRELTILTIDGLEIGSSTVTIDGNEFVAGEYVEYEFKTGDMFISGEWEARLFSQASNGSFCKITNIPLFFTIDP